MTAEITPGIGGISCASCAERVENAISPVSGAERAEVNLASEPAQTMVTGTPLLEQLMQLEQVVEAAGYGVATTYHDGKWATRNMAAPDGLESRQHNRTADGWRLRTANSQPRLRQERTA